MAKERLDVILHNKGYFETREKAKSAVMAGCVYINDEKAMKPGEKYSEDINISIKSNPNPYVSRGGLKLHKAIEEFHINLEGKICMDIGASTGGFTDCMLINGASKVFSVDVGYGQLAWKLRNDPRVVCMERTNFRYVKPEQIKEKIDFASVDVSFISLKKILPPAKALLNENGEMVCLIKPQFEAGREKVGKNGVVRDQEVHKDVVKNIVEFVKSIGFYIQAFTYSPIKGPEGNIEYLLYISVNENKNEDSIDYNEIINQSHNSSGGSLD